MPIPTSAPTLINRTRFQPPARPVFASMSAISFTSNSGSEVNHTGVRKVSVREFALRVSFDQLQNLGAAADTARATALSILARDFDRHNFTVLRRAWAVPVLRA
jgi:hypothetical protein